MGIRRGVTEPIDQPGKVTRKVEKWEAGMVVDGFNAGIRTNETQFGEGHLWDCDMPEGQRLTFSCPAILRSLLSATPIGVPVTVQCLGKERLKGGQDAWKFQVFDNAAGEREKLGDEPLPF